MNRRISKVAILLCTLVAWAGILPAGGQDGGKKKMTNQDVMDMFSMGLGEDVILEKIRTAPETDFATDLEALKALKAAHVSDPVIRTMINPKAAAAATASAAAPAAANPDVTEYQLLRLDMKGDRREFRSVTGGIIHSSGGAEKNAEKFDYEKVAPRVFRLKLPPLKKGEFGILPPGSTSGNVASSGKMYTFGVIE